jgi:hypothetical protein
MGDRLCVSGSDAGQEGASEERGGNQGIGNHGTGVAALQRGRHRQVRQKNHFIFGYSDFMQYFCAQIDRI